MPKVRKEVVRFHYQGLLPSKHVRLGSGGHPPPHKHISSIRSNFCFKVTKRLHVCSIRTLCVNVCACLGGYVCVRARVHAERPQDNHSGAGFSPGFHMS